MRFYKLHFFQIKNIILIYSIFSVIGCAKVYDYKNYSSEKECINLAYLNEIHEFVTKVTCANLDYPTAQLRKDDIQFSEQLMLLCIRHRLSNQIDSNDGWLMRNDIVRCAKKHGDYSGNEFATALLKKIPIETNQR